MYTKIDKAIPWLKWKQYRAELKLMLNYGTILDEACTKLIKFISI